MIVSWNWLSDYVDLGMTPAELESRLAMAGLNHEGTDQVGGDWAIDLEVTSNRPDCLGHLGVAREIGVLWDRPLRVPNPQPGVTETHVTDLCQVRIECPDCCPRYTARVIRGVKIGPSPDWLRKRLATLGIAAINNVVDVTNYVMMECGQPLHAFDFAKVSGGRIAVRNARKDEMFLAIDHRTYQLSADMCVIADAERAVALGGVMGGAESEVTNSTTDVLIEAAEFSPRSIRSTARTLNLHSPSSYRFERGVDPEGVEWASRRCCELILEVAGGELANGVCDVDARKSPPRRPIVLRLPQLKRVLGIDVDVQQVRRILCALGNRELRAEQDLVEIEPPSWRRDLTREIDLIEEVARVYGYDKIPENVTVPMVPSRRSDDDRVLERIRGVLTAAGFDEAMTASLVSETWSGAFSPWTAEDPLRSQTPMLRGADRLRRSLVPSLLGSLQLNQSVGNTEVRLFEIAKVYLPRANELPDERLMIGMASDGDYHELKGILEGVVLSLNPEKCIDATDARWELFDPARSAELMIDGKICGYLGEVGPSGRKRFGLRTRTTVAELDYATLARIACLIPRYRPLSPYPAIRQDVNLIVGEPIRWSDVAATVRAAGGPILESLEYVETYRDTDKDGAGKKRLLFTFTLRAEDRTLTSEEADVTRERVIEACGREHQAVLLA